jgi:hypothetical protein
MDVLTMVQAGIPKNLVVADSPRLPAAVFNDPRNVGLNDETGSIGRHHQAHGCQGERNALRAARAIPHVEPSCSHHSERH